MSMFPSDFGAEMSFGNIDDGYPDAICKALRKGILTEVEYASLKQTSNIQEFRLALEDTDFGNEIFQRKDAEHQDDGSEFEVQVLRTAMNEKLMSQINHIKANAVYPLTKFLDMMLHGYQIDNVVFVIEGLKSRRNPDELLRTANPLGMFPELHQMKPMGENEDYATLYQNLLIDLPIGLYFRKFLEEITEGAASDENVEIDAKWISEAMDDYSLSQIQLRVRKIWLKEFYKFCTSELNGMSAHYMMELLSFESDLMTLQVISNSLSYSGLVDARGRESGRKKYISNIGHLYPERMENLSKVTDFKSLIQAVEFTPYEDMLKQVSVADNDRNEAEAQGATIDEVMLTTASQKYSMAFEGNFHYGSFYAYLKLKEQEIKNVCWLAELVTLQVPRNLPGWNKYVAPWAYHVDELPGQHQ